MDYECAYFLTNKEWIDLKMGKIYPAAIRKVKDFKNYIMDDFLDITYCYRTKEQYALWYGEEFIKAQEYIHNRLSRDY